MDHLTAREAADMLGVKVPTLYAYTSRGLVRSVPGPKGRSRLYLRTDIERLRARRDARAGHGPAAAGALRWGEPVLDSSITAISRTRGPVYRGVAALELAEQGTPFERVAHLLWNGAVSDPGAADGDPGEWLDWRPDDLGMPAEPLRALAPRGLPPLSALALVTPILASHDPGRFAISPEAVVPRARRLIRRLAASLSRGFSEAPLQAALQAPSVASAVARAFEVPDSGETVAAIDRMLVICADHELNASTFAARVAASTGADVYACVSAALAALSGPRHGGSADRVEALLAEAGRPDHARWVVHERARRGDVIDGFGHPLYPAGDPRAVALIDAARSIASRGRRLETSLAIVDAMREESGIEPNMDMGLVVLCAALGLREGAPSGIFAIGRTAGWVAHALEQYEAGYLVRPRARYLEPGD